MRLRIALAIIFLPILLSAQGVITTIVGSDPTFQGLQGSATSNALGNLYSVAVRQDGTVFVADYSHNVIVSISPGGALAVVAGNGTAGYSGDGGPATQAMLNQPQGIAIDLSGILYIADSGNHRIRRVTNGTITTIAGTGTSGFSGDSGPATAAQLQTPAGITTDNSGGIFFVDSNFRRVRKITTTGTIFSIAGTGAGSGGDGGLATQAGFSGITGLGFDQSSSYIYVSDQGASRIRRFREGSTISTWAGTGTSGFSGDGGPAISAQIYFPYGLSIDAGGNLYFSDLFNGRIRMITPGNIINTVAGNGVLGGFSGDGGSPLAATFNYPHALAVDASGNLYIADTLNSRLRKVAGGIINTIGGNGNFSFGGDGGPATSALLSFVYSAVSDPSGNLFVADFMNNRVRKVSTGGIISTYAGTGAAASSGDGGSASSAAINGPTGLVLDSGGNLFVAEYYGNRIRKITSGGIISTFAGTGQRGLSGDGGAATNAQIGDPEFLALDTQSNLFFVDRGSGRIRKISGGVISTVAGTVNGNSAGDNGPATSAVFDPLGIAVDASGSLFISDNGGNRIRKVTGGTITTFAGTGVFGSSGDGGAATSANIARPAGLGFDPAGNLFVCTSGSIRKIISTGVISTAAGPANSTTTGFQGDGSTATLARINCASAGVDNAGNLLIADGSNNRVRRVTNTPPTLLVSPMSVSLNVVEGNNPDAQQIQLSGNQSGVSWSSSTSSTGSWLSASPVAGVLPSTMVISANSASLTPGTYTGTVNISLVTSTPVFVQIPVTLTVTAAPVGQLTAAPSSLSIQALQGSNPATQSLTIGNSGSGTLNWSATASTVNGGNWLSVSPASGSAVLRTSSVTQVSVNSQGLQPGVYNGAITLNPGGLSVGVRLVVSTSGGTLLLGQSGLIFTGIQDGGLLPAQSLALSNAGVGSLSWSASVLSGSWLAVTPASGIATSITSSAFQVQANVTGLAAGVYYGLVRVASTTASNSPQLVNVVLNVLPPTARAGVRVFPQGLILVAPAGTPASSSPTQTLTASSGSLSSVSASAITSVVQSPGVTNFLSVSPSNISLTPNGSMTVTASVGTLPVGIYQGTVTLSFADGSPGQDVSVVLLVTPSSSIQPERVGVPRAACTATKLVMVMRQLGSNFSSAVGWPVNLEAQVVDDCGTAVTNATVVASFSNGDAALALAPIGGGIYSATWKPGIPNTTTVTVRAIKSPLTSAVLTLSGQSTANSTPPPVIGSGGVVNGASFAAGAELAPGGIVSIFGSNLATSDGNQAAGFPLPTNLAGIKLTIGGIDAPLFYSGKGQVNAQVPFELAANSQSQVVARGVPASGSETIGVPEPIAIGSARPGIFLAGGSQGAILNVANQLVDASHTVTAGDVIVIYCTGLGQTNPAAVTGQPASASQVVLQPTVTVGGQAAGVQYAGLSPGFVGLYQVNVQIPAGVGAGPAVPVVITQNGIASNAATIGVR